MSESYIIITCAADADPEYNQLKLRTNPTTYIKLEPGVNILKIADYPELKYGFSQIDDDEFDESEGPSLVEYNCQSVFSIDLSHFDGSHMTSMADMFRRMENLVEINMSDLNTSNVTDMSYCFDRTESLRTVAGLNKIDTSKVTNMSFMFNGSRLGSCDYLDLRGFDVSHVLDMSHMFSFDTHLLNLSGWVLNPNCDMEGFWDCWGEEKKCAIKMNDCDNFTLEKVLNATSFYVCGNEMRYQSIIKTNRDVLIEPAISIEDSLPEIKEVDSVSDEKHVDETESMKLPNYITTMGNQKSSYQSLIKRPTDSAIARYKPIDTTHIVTLSELKGRLDTNDERAYMVMAFYKVSEERFYFPDDAVINIGIEERVEPAYLILWTAYYSDMQYPKQIRDILPYLRTNDRGNISSKVKVEGMEVSLTDDTQIKLWTKQNGIKEVNDIVKFSDERNQFIGFVVYID